MPPPTSTASSPHPDPFPSQAGAPPRGLSPGAVSSPSRPAGSSAAGARGYHRLSGAGTHRDGGELGRVVRGRAPPVPALAPSHPGGARRAGGPQPDGNRRPRAWAQPLAPFLDAPAAGPGPRPRARGARRARPPLRCRGRAQGRPAAPGTGEGYGATPDVTSRPPPWWHRGARHRAPEGLAARPAGTVAPPAMWRGVGGCGFVGRQAELARLLDASPWRLPSRRAARRSPASERRGSSPSSSPALHDEGLGCCGDAGRGDTRVLRPLRGGATPARRLRRRHRLRAAVGQRGDLQRLVPGLEERIGPLPAATRAHAGTEQRLLFEAVEDLLAPWTPLVVVPRRPPLGGRGLDVAPGNLPAARAARST